MDLHSASYAMPWTWVFCSLLSLNWLTQVWLASRQARHVARHRNAVPAAFAERVDLASHQKAADYTMAKTRLGLLSLSWGAVVLVGWTLLGGLDSLNLWLRSLGSWGGSLGQQLALLAGFTLVSGLLDLPLAWWRTFRLEAQFGFNKTTLALWLSDGLKGLLVGAVIGLPLSALVLWLMQATGPLWWLWAWTAWMAFNLLLMVIYPTLIAPIFNRFTPLNDELLRQRVEGLLQRCGFKARGLYVMDGSRRSAHANAYFTGFGPAKRVVFFDTLLQQLSPGEIDSVLAHELGHFKHRHIAQRMALMFLSTLMGFALLGYLSQQSWFYLGLGVRPNLDAPNNALALLLFISVAPLGSFFVTPLLNRLSRHHEFQADAYAVAHTNGQDLAHALLKLYRDNASTLTPDPVYVAFHYSHPPASERLRRLPSSTPSPHSA